MSLKFKRNEDGSWIGYRVDNKTDNQPPEPNNFPAMTDEQLSEYAAMKGVDISKARTRETVIAKLEKAEMGAE